MKRQKLVRRLLWTALVLFMLMNTVAFFHAYKFTHFDASPVKTKSAAQLSIADKLHLALFGVSNPRPKAKALPDTAYTTIRLRSNKEIECWWMRVQNPKGTVVLFHGYGGEKSSLLDKGAIFRQLGYSTMLVDFMGSGGSEGNQTTIGFKEAEQVKTCVRFLKENGEENIMLFGTSLGAAAVMKAMNDEPLPVSTLILECPFSTMLQTVKNRFATMGIPAVPMAHLLVFWGGVQNGFNAYSHNPVAYARNIQCPVLLFYGAKDEKVTASETANIFNNLAGLKKLVTFPHAGHENYLTKYKREWTTEVAQFLNGDIPVPAPYLQQ
ncbi:alpha/beta hydrolase [Pseudocnuella soli]|uniref:alpha/beta hydrolase n=1 Tax=Pseudocnuella soli TaxID=2502779 RepID=UPI001051292E|nr:alpha/beta fold hydrolase [Pseudocnuella soli]